MSFDAHSLDHKSHNGFDGSAVQLRNEINADAVNMYKYKGVYPLSMAWLGTAETRKTLFFSVIAPIGIFDYIYSDVK